MMEHHQLPFLNYNQSPTATSPRGLNCHNKAPNLLRLDTIPNNHYNYIEGFLVAFMDWGIVPKLMHMPLNCRPYLPPPSLGHGHGHGLGRPLLSYLHSPHLPLGRLWESSDAS